jgi:hypothetical protein
MELKVGDTIFTTNNAPDTFGNYVGKIGIIDHIASYKGQPAAVVQLQYSYRLWFYLRDLELYHPLTILPKGQSYCACMTITNNKDGICCDCRRK